MFSLSKLPQFIALYLAVLVQSPLWSNYWICFANIVIREPKIYTTVQFIFAVQKIKGNILLNLFFLFIVTLEIQSFCH